MNRYSNLLALYISIILAFVGIFIPKAQAKPDYEHAFMLRHIDRNLDLNDMGFLPRKDENRFNYSRDVPELNDSNHYKSLNSGQRFDYRTNNDGLRINSLLGHWLNFKFDDLTEWRLTVHDTGHGWNDKKSRGNGVYRTDGFLTGWSKWSSDQSKDFSYGISGWVRNEQIKGMIYNIKPFINYSPTDNISIDLETKFRHKDNWQVW